MTASTGAGARAERGLYRLRACEARRLVLPPLQALRPMALCRLGRRSTDALQVGNPEP